MTQHRAKPRPSTEPPLADWIVRDAITAELDEPYCVLNFDDDGQVQAIVHMLGYGVAMTRTYWPGHADHRWPPTRVARTPQVARWMLAERPAQFVAVPESVVQQMYPGWNLAFTSPNPE
jgi:hypothetical protein